jgi:hypothetical protein
VSDGATALSWPAVSWSSAACGHQRRAGAKITVTVEPFARLSATRRRALAEQVERVGEIMQAEPTLTIGTVSVGGHA